MDRLKVLADYYPLKDILEQNDIEPYMVIQWLIDEGLVDLDDYFYLEEEVED